MLKLYVEVSDIKGLDAWVAQGSLDNVYQIAVERHFLGGKWMQMNIKGLKQGQARNYGLINQFCPFPFWDH